MKSIRRCNSFIVLGVVVIMASLSFLPQLVSQLVFAATPEKINLLLKVDTKTIKFTDVNNNKKT
jgi:hypothetical protein